ncbi:hypothetical protein F2Q70_00042343 [Brassica cretica]|uniref:Uncharacterized protein n=1 Tax=Brassica cretica TaxID=69181 RepID=A0A8S9KJH1_BRACR|nr:hypothetical protein F2Q70_00042343 [Brassica cretica]
MDHDRSLYLTDRTLVRARSLSSDRAEWAFGRYVAILLEFLSDDSSLFRKGFRKEESISKKYSSEKFPTFFFFGDLDVNFVVTIFDPNTKFRCGDGRGYISGADSDFSGRSAGLCCRSSLLSREVSSSPSRERKCSSRRRVTVLFCTGRCSGHGTERVTPRDTGTLAGSVGPDASALPAGSSTTPILVEDKGRAADSMPLPPARKEIVLALHAPSVVPVIQPKGRKRKFTNGGDGESSQQGGSSIASGLRGKFVSLIDGMISECGSETSRLAGELLELQGRWSETEAMMTAVKGSHSVKVSKLEIAIGELERDLGKTASSLLKEKKARKAKSSDFGEVRRFERSLLQIPRKRILEKTDKRSSDVEMGEATSPVPIPTSPVEAPACVAVHLSFREKLVRRQAEKEKVRAGAELPSSSALAVAPGHGTDGVTPRDTGTLAGSVVPDASTLPAGSSTTPILVEDKERAADSMPPPPVRKEIVLALHAPSVVPVTQPKGRKRKFTKGGDGESSQQGDSSIASGLRGKFCRSLTFLIVVYFSKRQRISNFLLVSQFVSLIDGMISECGSETSRLAGELLELRGKWSETEAMLTAVKGSHSVKVSKLEIAIGELERDLGKTASSLLKEKKARKAKSSEF